jgi:hypothetical protein
MTASDHDTTVCTNKGFGDLVDVNTEGHTDTLPLRMKRPFYMTVGKEKVQNSPNKIFVINNHLS